MEKRTFRLPLNGIIDLTYRCNNFCHHCWLWEPANNAVLNKELSLVEIRRIVDEARSLGCRSWSISGGEPMLRPDFSEIFLYITNKSVFYSLNTNGTLITPEIAKLMKGNGKNMVALYGATAEVHDHITRNSGSFDSTMRGFSYLREAGAKFIVQIIPMKENYHQFKDMQELATSLSPQYRIGSTWLFLSACQSKQRNTEINRQRLSPDEVLTVEQPVFYTERSVDQDNEGYGTSDFLGHTNHPDDGLFYQCITERNEFHIDPYGMLSFCYYIKDPALRYDLRRGTFREGWEEFIPSLANLIRGGDEYRQNCGSCDFRSDCHWCGVYGYLEHGRFSAKVDYLCKIAQMTRTKREEWKASHSRYYSIGGMTIHFSTDFPLEKNTLSDKFNAFRVQEPGADNIAIRWVSKTPRISTLNLGEEIYHKTPWIVYRQRDSFVYRGITPDEDLKTDPHLLVITDGDHDNITIYRDNDTFHKGNLPAITSLSTDQILLARSLLSRDGCYIHSAGIVINNEGYLFVGHSSAGKSTMLKLLRGAGEILCDDRNIIRRSPDGYRLFGTWSHGELTDVSPKSAPLKALFYIEQASTNELIPITDKLDRFGRLLSYVIRPIVTEDWWEKTLKLAGFVAAEVPAYRTLFDKSGKIKEVLQQLE